MILTVAVFLSALGFVFFVLGNLLGYHEIGLIGATLIIGVGFMVTTGGVETKVGEVHTTPDNSTTQIEYKYQPTNTPESLPVGVLLMLAGGTLGLRSLNQLSQ